MLFDCKKVFCFSLSQYSSKHSAVLYATTVVRQLQDRDKIPTSNLSLTTRYLALVCPASGLVASAVEAASIDETHSSCND